MGLIPGMVIENLSVRASLQSPLWPPPSKETTKEGKKKVSGDTLLAPRRLCFCRLFINGVKGPCAGIFNQVGGEGILAEGVPISNHYVRT